VRREYSARELLHIAQLPIAFGVWWFGLSRRRPVGGRRLVPSPDRSARPQVAPHRPRLRLAEPGWEDIRAAARQLDRGQDRGPGTLSSLQQIPVVRHEWYSAGVRKSCKLSVSNIRNVFKLVWVCVTPESIVFAEERRNMFPR
jgi:hypothetical protein